MPFTDSNTDAQVRHTYRRPVYIGHRNEIHYQLRARPIGAGLGREVVGAKVSRINRVELLLRPADQASAEFTSVLDTTNLSGEVVYRNGEADTEFLVARWGLLTGVVPDSYLARLHVWEVGVDEPYVVFHEDHEEIRHILQFETVT